MTCSTTRVYEPRLKNNNNVDRNNYIEKKKKKNELIPSFPAQTVSIHFQSTEARAGVLRPAQPFQKTVHPEKKKIRQPRGGKRGGGRGADIHTCIRRSDGYHVTPRSCRT